MAIFSIWFSSVCMWKLRNTIKDQHSHLIAFFTSQRNSYTCVTFRHDEYQRDSFWLDFVLIYGILAQCFLNKNICENNSYVMGSFEKE